MIRLKKILVPTDFSEFSRHALRYGCEFARQFQAELHLLHVLQDLVNFAPEASFVLASPAEFLREAKENAERALAEFPKSEWVVGTRIVSATCVGVPFLEIIRYAKEKDVDLIVMATHGRTGLAHILIGSVTEKVVRKAPCPVLTIRHPEHEFVMP